MKIGFDMKGGFDETEKWLKQISASIPSSTINKIADEGVKALSKGTPRDTGETASGWKSKVTTRGSVLEVSWVNDAHPNESVNLAKLIEYGYVNGTGGYVTARPYVKQSIRHILDSAGDRVMRELSK